MPRPSWQLPVGVTRGTLDYAESLAVATDYDSYHADNPLFQFEEQLLTAEFSTPGVVADLGCGTGRALLPMVRAGHTGVAVDLSPHMLEVVKQQAEAESLDVRTVQANLVDLSDDASGGIADDSVDYAMCLFSTLGMIRGRENRRQALLHMQRILRPGGKLVLHVHNFWFNLRDAPNAWGGPWWVAKNLIRPITGSELEIGDKFYPYRGIPNFFLHVFRKRELTADLTAASLRAREWLHLDVKRRHALKHAWCLPAIRANGWIVVCEKPSS